ncbi:MAG: hypothetical protein MRY81_25665 [Donghicola eburneus]|jgi:outer membrane protein|nr:hypothetical protein [Donghicola eburneus]MCI5043036.1 hypothetical protein [Donghicola eburneus]
MRARHILTTIAALLASAAVATAQDFSDRKIELKAGLTGVIFDERAQVAIGGATVPGGSARVDDNLTATFDLGYFFRPDVSV